MKYSCVKRIALAIAALPAFASAQNAGTAVVPYAQPGYWTPERFKAAKPLDLPKASPEAMRNQFEATNSTTPAGRSGSPPKVSAAVSARQLFVPDAPAVTVQPFARGTSAADYTSTQVFPLFTGAAAPYSADRAYPHRAAGKLFFSINNVPYVCSASVIGARILATAGHCVHSGTASGYYGNFVYVPSYRDGVAPFLSWTPRVVRATATWIGGGGGVPNAADYAMMEMNDQPYGGVVRRIGEVTGWFGWQTVSLARNHTSKLGYPMNLDSGEKMQNVMSSNFQNVAPNTVTYGSDARGGGSGSAWVQNLEIVSAGQDGLNTGSNRVVGITSYGPVDPAIKYTGSSILDNRWSTMYSDLCALRAGNC